MNINSTYLDEISQCLLSCVIRKMAMQLRHQTGAPLPTLPTIPTLASSPPLATLRPIRVLSHFSSLSSLSPPTPLPMSSSCSSAAAGFKGS